MIHIKRLLNEIMTPTDGSPYLWAIIGIGHVMIGALLQGLLGVTAAIARISLAIIYWFIKERGDLKRGGSLKDGLIDSAFVGVGAFYDGSRWWPIMVLVTVSIAALVKESKLYK